MKNLLHFELTDDVRVPLETKKANQVLLRVSKLKNKKTLKMVSKLREFASNSYSYLQVILFQCKVRAQRLERNPNPLQIENLISRVLGTGGNKATERNGKKNGESEDHCDENDLVRANSLKMMYSMLRDSRNLYP